MLITISDNLYIEDLQDRFTHCFPDLKIQFYYEPRHLKHGSAALNVIAPHTLVGDVREIQVNDILEIKSWYTAEAVEKEFIERFGLYAQVFHQQNGKWVHSAKERHLTLKELSQFMQQLETKKG